MSRQAAKIPDFNPIEGDLRLSNASLDRLPGQIHRPGYDRSRVRPGIVHLGIGAFHRAHQAVMIDDLLAGGATDWGTAQDGGARLSARAFGRRRGRGFRSDERGGKIAARRRCSRKNRSREPQAHRRTPSDRIADIQRTLDHTVDRRREVQWGGRGPAASLAENGRDVPRQTDAKAEAPRPGCASQIRDPQWDELGRLARGYRRALPS